MLAGISLVPLNSRFLNAYYANFTESITCYQLAEPFQTPREAADYFFDCRQRELAGYSYVRVILDKNGAFLGSIEANALTGAIPSVGLWLCEECQKQGYGSMVLGMVLNYLHEKGFHYVLYETDIRNKAANALLAHYPYSDSETIETVYVNESKTLMLKKHLIRL